MASFDQLRKGGRFTMYYRKRDQSPVPVSVRANSIDKDIILIKHLDATQRGSIMAVYKDQIERGVFTFQSSDKSVVTTISINYPPQQKSRSLYWVDLALTILLLVPFSDGSIYKAIDNAIAIVLVMRVLVLLRRCIA